LFDTVLYAFFYQTEVELVLLADPDNGGTVTGGGTHPCGERVTITATANDKFIFRS